MSYKLMLGLVVAVVVVIGGYSVWSHHSGSSDLANLDPDAKLTDDQVAQVTARIGEYLVLPTDEKPTVAVIKNADQLAVQQTFYKDAMDGQLLVLYSNRAIIYDPKDNKLVNVGPIVRNDASPSPTASESPMPSVAPKNITVDVLNGSGTAGLAGTTASTLKKNTLFTIGKVGDAAGTYKATVVVNLSTDPAKTAAVAELAKALKVSEIANSLPSGEKSTADALVIIGK